MDDNKIAVEFSIRELQIVIRAIRSYSPQQDDEMISMMLYTRFVTKLQEKNARP